MSNILEIKLHEDLGDSLLNEMRYRMEMCDWRKRNREAHENEDSDHDLDLLQEEYERIGLP